MSTAHHLNADSLQSLGLTTHDGYPISFSLSEDSDKHSDEEVDPWVVYKVIAHIPVNRVVMPAGHLKFSFIPNEIWEEMIKHEFLSEIAMYAIHINGYRVDLDQPEENVLTDLYRHFICSHGDDNPFLTHSKEDAEYQTAKAYLLDTIDSSQRKKFDRFQSVHADKPIIEYLMVEDILQRNGIGNALYMATAHLLADNGLHLHSSSVKSKAGRANFSRFHKDNPHMVKKVGRLFAISPDFEYDLDCV